MRCHQSIVMLSLLKTKRNFYLYTFILWFYSVPACLVMLLSVELLSATTLFDVIGSCIGKQDVSCRRLRWRVSLVVTRQLTSNEPQGLAEALRPRRTYGYVGECQRLVPERRAPAQAKGLSLLSPRLYEP